MSLSDYLDLTLAQAEGQWLEIRARQDATPSRGRVNHTPVETLLAGAVRVVANVRAGGGDGRSFPFPVPELARLFRRKRDLETAVEQEMGQRRPEALDTDSATERALVRMLRVGQSAFASEVLRNYGEACAFCGFALGDGRRPSLLRAGHIKPWRDSDRRERLDVANGIAACPTHDAAFDTGLMTLDTARDHLTVRVSPRLRSAANRNPATARHFTGDGLRERIELTLPVVAPADEYLSWHRERIFT